MEAHAPLQVLKKRAKGDLNKQRRIKNLAKNKEFVELVQIAAGADIPGTDRLSDGAVSAWELFQQAPV